VSLTEADPVLPSGAVSHPPARPGLRERKKRRTRETLVDVAAELCLRQGYDNTTVEQIAAAAEVSPRTFSRYFPTKEAVIAAFAEEIAHNVADALGRQPADISELEALRRAHVEIFDPAGPYAPDAFNRMAVIIGIVRTSPTLHGSAFAMKQSVEVNPTVQVLADRMGLAPTATPVRLVADLYTLLTVTTFSSLTGPLDPHTLCDRLTQTFEMFEHLRSPWRQSGYPRSGIAPG
jgi:AcrR family transcriptional regulator